MDCSTALGQRVHGEEAQKDHNQDDCMPPQGEGGQLGYQHGYPVFPYQDLILYNNQV